jgi:hypothetical protein
MIYRNKEAFDYSIYKKNWLIYKIVILKYKLVYILV